MMKKLLSLLLVSIMLFASLSFATNAEAENVASAHSSEQSELLYALDVLDSPDLTTNLVTRAQFVKYAMKLAGIPLSPYTGAQFEDVQANHEYYDYIMSAVDFGLISVSNRFRPEDTITPTEAIKIIINLLGYDFMAQAKGGYPTGYLQTAQSIDLSKGIDVSVFAMTEYDACVLLYNALKVNLPEVSYTGEGASDYYIGSATLLEKYRGIIEIMGIVDGVSHYSEYNVNGYGEGRVSINGTIYNTGTLNCDMLYGYDVTAYYNTKEKALITCTPSDTNRVVSIYAEDIESFTNGVCTYTDENNKSRSVSVNRDSTIFYNGRLFAYDKLKLIPQSGSLTFVSPNGSGAYSTLYIKSYKTIVVQRTSMSDEYIIVDKYSTSDGCLVGGKLVIDPNNANIVITDQDGNEIPFSSINTGDIVNVAVSDDDKFYELICVKDEILGTYSAYSSDYIEIDGSRYRLSSALEGKVSDIVSLGKQAIFRLDIDKRVADIVPAVSVGEEIGYLVIGRVYEQGMTTNLAVRILNLDGIIYDYYLADTFTINGETYKDFKKAYDKERSKDYDSLPCSLVKYTLNADGKIKSLVYSDKEGGNGGLYFTNRIDKANDAKLSQWYNSIENRIIANADTIIIRVPDPVHFVNNIDEERYSVDPASIFFGEDSIKEYKLTGYTTNPDDGMSAYLLAQKIGDDGVVKNDVGNEPGTMMVSSVRKVVINGEPREKLILGSPSAPVEVYSKGENDFSAQGIQGGDLVRVTTNDYKVVTALEIIYKKGSSKLEGNVTSITSNTSTKAYKRIIMAYPYSFRGDVMDVVSVDILPEYATDDNIFPLYVPGKKVYKYDDRLKSVVELSINELHDYKNFEDEKSTIVYHTRYEEIDSIFLVD